MTIQDEPSLPQTDHLLQMMATPLQGGTRRPPAAVYVVLLNWNGWRDTVACLASLRAAANATAAANAVLIPVLVDNGSTDDSLAQISAWAEAQREADGRPAYCLERYVRVEGVLTPDGIEPAQASERLVLVSAGENLGFAAGTNVGLAFALTQPDAAYTWVLNNDTIVTPTAATALVAALETHPELDVLTPQIRLHAQPERIWNCGGFLTRTASRSYLYGGALVAGVPTQGLRRVTFVTGCALFARAQLWRDEGLLSERFFFGEEDYEFSRRMRKRGRAIACCFEAVIYHKVGAAARNAMPASSTARIYLHYLNRFVHIRSEWPRFWWRLWRLASALYILPMLRFRFGVPFGRSLILFRDVLHESATLASVDRATFERIMTSAATVEKISL